MRLFPLSRLARTNHVSQLLLALLALSQPIAATANVPSLYHDVATEYGIPPLLLYAIALVESATPLKDGTTQPWPWTLSISAKPYYYATRNEALAAFRWARQQNVTQLGIGLMQIEWRFHGKRFENETVALDPGVNVRTGADILRTEYQNAGKNWDLAVKRYHSRTEKFQQAYVRRVNRVLQRLAKRR